MQDAGRDERLTVAEAADRLGITKEAVRKRIARGTLRADKDARGTVRVYVPVDDPASTTTDRAALVEILREQVEDLRRERDEWREQARMTDRLLAAALERIPELPAGSPPDERESPTAAAEEPERAEPRPAGRERQEPREDSGMHMPEVGGGPLPHDQQRPSERPWWRFWA